MQNSRSLKEAFDFLQEWKEKDVISIQDILDNDGKSLTFKSFQDKFKIKCNFLSYLQVISAIPKHLLHKAKCLDRWESLTTDKTTFLLTPSLNTTKWSAMITIGFTSMVLPVLPNDPKSGKKN